MLTIIVVAILYLVTGAVMIPLFDSLLEMNNRLRFGSKYHHTFLWDKDEAKLIITLIVLFWPILLFIILLSKLLLK